MSEIAPLPEFLRELLTASELDDDLDEFDEDEMDEFADGGD